MPKLPVIKNRELVRVLKKLGFYLHHQVGSHAQFKHKNGRRITVPMHYGKYLHKKYSKALLMI
ncbi:MAG: type II toxin-antitoxin system HicA family toxin [Patescibacteria group bacterium]